jgi:hypothetical protein
MLIQNDQGLAAYALVETLFVHEPNFKTIHTVDAQRQDGIQRTLANKLYSLHFLHVDLLCYVH